MNGLSESLRKWAVHGVPAGRAAGIDVRLHPSFAAVAACWVMLAWARSEPGGAAPEIAEALALAGVLLGSVLVHEAAHARAAALTGTRTREMVLWPLGGLTRHPGALRSPYDEFAISLAGPAASLALCLLAAGAARIPPGPGAAGPGAPFAWFWAAVRDVNLLLFILNAAVPLPPFDGARLLRAALAMRGDARRATGTVCLTGLFGSGFLACLFVSEFSAGPAEAGPDSILLALGALVGAARCLEEMIQLDYENTYREPARHRREFMAMMGLPGRAMKPLERALRRRPSEAIVPPRRASAVPPPQGALSPEEAELRRAEQALAKAVRDEDYLLAAQIRDKLRSMKTAAPPRR